MFKVKSSQPYLLQVWILPGLELNEEVVIYDKPRVTIRAVRLTKPGIRDAAPIEFQSTFIQMEGTGEDMFQPTPDILFLGKQLLKLSFNLLKDFQVFSVRMIPRNIQVGDEFEQLLFGGVPPGLSLINTFLVNNSRVELEEAFLQRVLPQTLETAISWFVKGTYSSNAMDQFISYWIGLETLAPKVSGSWNCNKCGSDTPNCPDCGRSTQGANSVLTIRSFIENTLGVSRDEFDELHKTRNNISHGQLSQNFDGVETAVKVVNRVHQLLLSAIKNELGWPDDKLPLSNPKWIEWEGQNVMVAKATLSSIDDYHRPPIFIQEISGYDRQIYLEQTGRRLL